MKGHGAKYERKKEEAIVAFLTQKNIEEAARSIGIGSATLLRWLKDPDFDTAYREARRAAFRQSVARLQQASGAAVVTATGKRWINLRLSFRYCQLSCGVCGQFRSV